MLRLIKLNKFDNFRNRNYFVNNQKQFSRILEYCFKFYSQTLKDSTKKLEGTAKLKIIISTIILRKFFQKGKNDDDPLRILALNAI